MPFSLLSWAFSSQVKHPQLRFNFRLVSYEMVESVKAASYSPPLLGITKGVNAANYVFWLHSLQPTVQPTPENKTRGPVIGDCIDLNDIRFSYPLRPDIPILRGVNLKVCLNQVVEPLQLLRSHD